MDYRVDVDSQKAHKSLDLFLRDLEATLQARVAAYRHLWHKEEWDTFVLIFTGTDRLAHFLWDAYEDETHKHRSAFVEHFRQIDQIIGEIVQDLRSGDSLLMLSDHGFERLNHNVFVNHLLVREGFLAFGEGAPANLRTITDGTLAFALDPGRIYLHTKGRYPRGGVEPQDEKALLRDLESLFNSLEIEGQKVIKNVFRAEELYEGPEAPHAPHLVLLGNSGYNLRGNMKATQLVGTDLFAGKHSQHDAFLLVWGASERGTVPEAPSVTDVVNILDTL
jgi:predicted AlkP superfamily phosphohydrolase/phosphomutase